jgi:hypothetical protein
MKESLAEMELVTDENAERDAHVAGHLSTGEYGKGYSQAP